MKEKSEWETTYIYSIRFCSERLSSKQNNVKVNSCAEWKLLFANRLPFHWDAVLMRALNSILERTLHCQGQAGMNKEYDCMLVIVINTKNDICDNSEGWYC